MSQFAYEYGKALTKTAFFDERKKSPSRVDRTLGGVGDYGLKGGLAGGALGGVLAALLAKNNGGDMLPAALLGATAGGGLGAVGGGALGGVRGLLSMQPPTRTLSADEG